MKLKNDFPERLRILLAISYPTVPSDVKSHNLASYVAGRRSPSKATYNKLAKFFKVNREWLENGMSNIFPRDYMEHVTILGSWGLTTKKADLDDLGLNDAP